MKRKMIILVLLGLGLPTVLLAVEAYNMSGTIEYTAASPLGQWTGSNSSVKGSISVGPVGGKVCIDQSAWDSKNRKRDDHTRTMFSVESSPQACLVVTGLDGSLAGGSVTARGSLTIKGVSHDVTIPGNVSVKGGHVHFEGSMDLKLSDYKIERPSVMGVQVKDDVHVRIVADGVRP